MSQTPIEKRKAELVEFIEARKRAIPGPWFHDMGNWEIETHNNQFYRQAVCNVQPESRKTCDGNHNEWSSDFETPDFIVLAANQAERMASDLLKAIEALEKISDYFCACSIDDEIIPQVEAQNALKNITKGPGGV